MFVQSLYTGTDLCRGSDSFNAYENKTVLVAGGAGFLGSHLCETLLRHGARVHCLDNLSTGREDNIAALRALPGFAFLNHDVVDPINVPGPIDAIYNLASPASPPHYQAHPIHTLRTNFCGSINLLELAVAKQARILQASTSEVYGDPLQHPQAETYNGNVNTIGRRACYDEGKRCAETLFFEYARKYGLTIKVARIFNTYGPRMQPDDGRVVSNFIVQALQGADITIYGSGGQTRSFCYVDDLIAGLMRLMASPASFSGPVNLGNPGEFTVKDLARRVLALTGSRSRLVHLPLPEDDPKVRRPDIALARQMLAWEPKIALAEGLPKAVAYFASYLSGSGATREAAE